MLWEKCRSQVGGGVRRLILKALHYGGRVLPIPLHHGSLPWQNWQLLQHNNNNCYCYSTIILELLLLLGCYGYLTLRTHPGGTGLVDIQTLEVEAPWTQLTAQVSALLMAQPAEGVLLLLLQRRVTQHAHTHNYRENISLNKTDLTENISINGIH